MGSFDVLSGIPKEETPSNPKYERKYQVEKMAFRLPATAVASSKCIGHLVC
jgi:hypothetical protein